MRDEMSDEQMRIAIAEACGYMLVQATDGAWETWKDGKSIYADSDPEANFMPLHVLPNYLTDLNAMHEAEKTLGSLLGEYIAELVKPLDRNKWVFQAITASARQRAEAFLRAKGLWKE